MPTLLHLNGPPAVGKSTIAAELIKTRPLALNLDIDELRVRLGQWESRDDSKSVARALGFNMAAEHLSNGHDVVLPQLVLLSEVIDQLESLAANAGAAFVEVVLVSPDEELMARIRQGRGDLPHPRYQFDVDELESRVSYARAAAERLGTERPAAHLIDIGGLTTDEAVERVRKMIGWD